MSKLVRALRRRRPFAILLLAAAVCGVTPGLPSVPAKFGALVVPVPSFVVGLGSLGATGALEVSVPMPELGPAVSSGRAFVQAVFCPVSAACVLGPGSVLIGIDAQF